MITHDLLTATDAAAYIKSGAISSTALIQQCLDRIEHREPLVHAWQHLDVDLAMTQAISCDQVLSQSTSLGPLHGIPIAIKDIFATTDMPTSWGTPIHANQHLPYDAAVVERLRAAGAVIMGKTVSTEYALARAGKTQNPHDPNHTPGGSSSGSAAAVAAGMVPLAIGTQTSGSVLRPAAYCGVVGFKPSFGSISRHGVMPVSRDLDHVGLFAHTVTDIVYLCSVLMGADGRDPDCLGGSMPASIDFNVSLKQTPRIGFVRTSAWPEVDPDVQAALLQSLDYCRRAGAIVIEIAMPEPWESYLSTVDILMTCGAAINHGQDYDCHHEDMSPKLRQVIERGRTHSSLAYATARQKVVDYSVALAPLLAQVDVMVTPVTPGTAPAGLNDTGSPIFCAPWTLLGVPTISLPIGKGANHLPIGMQLVGSRGQDRSLLEVAQWVMAKLGYPYSTG